MIIGFIIGVILAICKEMDRQVNENEKIEGYHTVIPSEQR